MMHSRTVEIWVGVLVVLAMAALFMLAMKVSNLNQYAIDDGYLVKAHFSNIGGLKTQSQVSVAGVRIGRIESIDYDPHTFDAVVTMKIGSQYNTLPSDTSASIFTSGLLGEQYIALEPGGAEDYLKHGDEIKITQSAVILEQMIGQLLFQKASE